MKLCFKSDQVIAKNGKESIMQWKSKTDISTYLKPLRQKDDPKMPSDREGLEKMCYLWRFGEIKTKSSDDYVLEEFEKWKQDELAKNRGKRKQKS